MAELRKAIHRPSALITAALEPWLPAVAGNPMAWLTRVTVPVARSARKTSLPG